MLSPSSGIVDSHALMLSLQGDAEAAGAVVAFRSPVMGGRVGEDGIVLDVGGDDRARLRAAAAVNCAALNAQTVAAGLEGLNRRAIPRRYLAKGNYFTLRGSSPFERLIYPMPRAGGLGVHLTMDLAGQARFGPDVEWVEKEEYDVDPNRADAFYAAVRTYWPDLRDGALLPDYAGIRPKIQAAGAPVADFAIQGPADHGARGLVNLYGIESPGLTAALAIAEMVAEMVWCRETPSLMKSAHTFHKALTGHIFLGVVKGERGGFSPDHAGESVDVEHVAGGRELDGHPDVADVLLQARRPEHRGNPAYLLAVLVGRRRLGPIFGLHLAVEHDAD